MPLQRTAWVAEEESSWRRVGWLVATVCGVGRNGIHGTNFREYAHIRIVRCCGCVADSVSNEEQPLEDDALMATIKCLQYSST